jgi:hypothetical protein
MRCIQNVCSMAAIVVGALFTVAAWSAGSSAQQQRLDCILTDKDGQPGSESRSIVVAFDEHDKTMMAKEENGHSYSFTRVTISNVSINGQADNISLGIDRSSLGIVWQEYGADKVNTEYGHCRTAPAP